VAAEGDRVVGFVAGSTDVRGLYRTFLLHDGVPAAAEAAGRLLRGWRRALETLRHGAGAGTGRGVELLAIAVDPDRQGRGTGRHLVTGFLDAVRSGGGGAAYVVVAADNDRAVGLYRGAGFVAGPPFELHAGTSSLVMQWDEGRSAATESRS
jgi:ribosomal protein S18 acetylase RimI-like enzyme